MAHRRRRSGDEGARAAPDLVAAMELALRYLGTRPRTRWEIEHRLVRAGCSEATVAAAVDRLAELGYVDDEAFARWWTEQRDRHAPRGRRLVEAELRQHGVPRDVIEALRDEVSDHPPAEDLPTADETVLPQDEGARARVALERHLRGRPVPNDARALQRLGMFLMRRGFDAETVRATINGLRNELRQ